MDKKLTIIIPHLNEEEELEETVKSIFNTIDIDKFEIVTIDDCSTKTTDLSKYSNVRQIRNKNRIGVDGSRQLGVDQSQTDHVLILDSHMRFKKDNWASKIIDCIDREPETLWCTTCLGLGYGTMDLNQHKGKYKAADMLFVDSNAKPDRPAREVLEPKWSSISKEGEYDIPCILGANYGFSKKWFNYIHGLMGLKMWGTSEPFLSMKSWMTGGKCKITTSIEIGHKFRSNAPYSTMVAYLVYNKIYLCKTILPEDLGQKLINYLPKDVNYNQAIKMIDKDKNEIEREKQYYQSIFKNSIYDYCERFNISLP